MEDDEIDRRTGGTRQGVILLLASVMPIMAVISLVPVLPLLLEEFQDTAGSAFLVPIAMTVPALCVAVFSPLAGWIADRVGRKRLLVCTLAIYGFAGVLPWFLGDLFQIIAARIVLGVMEAAIMTVATVLIGDYFNGKRRESWLSMQVAVGSVAAIILIAVSGLLGEAFGSRGPFLLYLLALPIAVLAALFLFEPARKTDLAGSSADAFPFGTVLPVVAITVIVGVLFYTLIVQLGPILQLSGQVSPATIGIIGAATNLGVAGGSLIFRKLGKPPGMAILALGLTVSGLGYLGASLITGLRGIAAFSVMICIGCGILLPNLITWVMSLLPLRFRGRGTGVWTGAFFLGQFLAPVIATALAVPLAGLGGVLQFYGVLALGSAVLVFIIAKFTAAGGRNIGISNER